MSTTASVIRAYYDSWTARDFGAAASLLGGGLIVEVPVNDYPTTESFVAALTAFGSLAARVELQAEMSDGDEGMLLYDMDVAGLGALRVAEHLTVRDGKIVRLRQVHDTAALREAGFVAEDGYRQRLMVQAPRERVWDAVGTAAGPRHWWTTMVTGSAEAGGELRFGFAGLPEEIVMLVAASRRPVGVTWRCLAHSRDQEWTGSELSFALADYGPDRCELTFRHTGVASEVVAGGWRHFLSSLTAYCEGGPASPFGA